MEFPLFWETEKRPTVSDGNQLMSGGCLRIKKWIKILQRRKLITRLYTNLSESHAGSRYNELLDHVQSKVTTDTNNFPLKEYTMEEIKEALDG